MPRQARIDAPGALHHMVIRGIERKAIFEDDKDREDFLERLSGLLQEMVTPCYAWAMMTNHVHLLLRTGKVPIASIMRRLLTGYAVRFNRRHRRHGHLFQNRYKSILCEEDRYLKQLVDIHSPQPCSSRISGGCGGLESLRLHWLERVDGQKIQALARHGLCAGFFGRRVSEARRNLESHVCKWFDKGRCPQLTGGGLIRSAGGWHAVKEAYWDGVRLACDERILGSSEFVETALKHFGEIYDRRMQLQSAGIDLTALIAAVCRWLDIDDKEMAGPTKRIEIARARALISYTATRNLSISGSEVARRLNVDRSVISRAAQRVSRDPELIAAVETLLGLPEL